jgi:hypothetical protein
METYEKLESVRYASLTHPTWLPGWVFPRLSIQHPLIRGQPVAYSRQLVCQLIHMINNINNLTLLFR